MALQNPPAGYHSITPYIVVAGAIQAIEFYQQVFDAQELFRLPAGDNQIGHAELKIGDSVIMLADEHPDMGFLGPKTIGGTPVSLLLYVQDVDAVTARCQAAGAKLLRPLTNQFYGDRTAMIQDPFGHTWTIATHVEDVSHEEMQRRMAKMHT